MSAASRLAACNRHVLSLRAPACAVFRAHDKFGSFPRARVQLRSFCNPHKRADGRVRQSRGAKKAAPQC
eukprot:2598783-Pleurochrysis_carterae.AAC.1